MPAYSEHLIGAAVRESDAGRFAGAAHLLRLALGHSGRDAFVLYGLGHMAYRQDAFAEAVAWLDQSLAMDAGNAKAHVDRGLALFGLRQDRAALASLERGLEQDAALAMAVMTEGMAELRAGRFRTGWWKFEARLVASPGLSPRRRFAEPRWSGDPAELAGRTLLLHSEQGHGDAIQMARYVPLLAAMGGTLLLEGHPALLPLYRASLDVAGVFALNDRLPRFDLECPLLSLPLALRTEAAGIPARVPYLRPPADRVALWRRLLGPAAAVSPGGVVPRQGGVVPAEGAAAPREGGVVPREGAVASLEGGVRQVGLAWSGNPVYAADAGRSLPLATLAPLLSGTAHRFHVVQTEIRPADRRVLLLHPHVRDHSERLLDFADTAALLSLLDLLITVDTSVAHLAGALGIPVWLLLPEDADWRWQTGRTDSPWYPSMRLFRQPRPGDWDSVVGAVLAALGG
jgi:hypothetical protein